MTVHIKFLGGVVVAVLAGLVLNMGSLIQKKAVNQLVYIKKKRLLTSLNEDPIIDKDKYPLYFIIVTKTQLQFFHHRTGLHMFKSL